MRHKTIGGGRFQRAKGSLVEHMTLMEHDRAMICTHWNSSTERRYFHTVLLPGLKYLPQQYSLVIVKPRSILLGETRKAVRYQPDFLVQMAQGGVFYLIEVKGEIVTPEWRKTLRCIEERLELGVLSTSIDDSGNFVVKPHLIVATYSSKSKTWSHRTYLNKGTSDV